MSVSENTIHKDLHEQVAISPLVSCGRLVWCPVLPGVKSSRRRCHDRNSRNLERVADERIPVPSSLNLRCASSLRRVRHFYCQAERCSQSTKRKQRSRNAVVQVLDRKVGATCLATITCIMERLTLQPRTPRIQGFVSPSDWPLLRGSCESQSLLPHTGYPPLIHLLLGPPAGSWVCCLCRQTNSSSMSPSRCPIDGHYKCDRCFKY